MAMLRLASSRAVPNALCAISSPRNLSQSITNAFSNSQEESLFMISQYLSTDAKKQSNDHKLVKILKSQMESTQLFIHKSKPSTPANFPFTIQDDSRDSRKITLTRELDGEKIQVLVYLPLSILPYEEEESCFNDNESNVDDGSSSTDHSNSDEQKKKSHAHICLKNKSLSLDVKISKENGKKLAFRVSAFPDRINIKSMSAKEPGADSLICYSSDESVMDEELDSALREFLEIRGIKKSYYNFLHRYMVWNFKRDLKVSSNELLGKLKKFIEHRSRSIEDFLL